MQGLELLGINFTKKNEKNKDAIFDNMSAITKFLEDSDIESLKLSCKHFYYYFVTCDIWLGMKLNIAEEKLEYYNDYDFEEVEAKQISKKDKNIRIHSLKKQAESKSKGLVKREPSNIKEKGKIIMQNNELLFRNTEIGFKRLLKTNSKKKVGDNDYDIKEVTELPKISSLDEYSIKISDPWSLNMDKANKLTAFFKKVNEFHNKFLTELKLPSKDVNSLSLKLKKSEQKCQIYKSFETDEINKKVISSIEGAKQNLLIDEQLNKICRLFWNYHNPMVIIENQITKLNEILEREKIKNAKSVTGNTQDSVEFVEHLSSFDEFVEVITNFCEANQEVGKLIAPQFINIFHTKMEEFEQRSILFEDTDEEIRIDFISWNALANKPFFSETVFQILASLTSRLIKISGSLCPDDLSLSITITKVKNVKSVSQALLNISKYFGKITKQIEEKEKKGKDGKTSDSIKQFLTSYQTKNDEYLYLVKNPVKLDKLIGEFKEKISNLKNKIQSS